MTFSTSSVGETIRQISHPAATAAKSNSGGISGNLSPLAQMVVALAADVTYVLCATQFILNLRRARLDCENAQGVAA